MLLLQYTITATPVGGGAPVKLTVSSPSATLTGLAPGTQYRVTATGTSDAGQTSAASSAVLMTTPAAGWVQVARCIEDPAVGTLPAC